MRQTCPTPIRCQIQQENYVFEGTVGKSCLSSLPACFVLLASLIAWL